MTLPRSQEAEDLAQDEALAREWTNKRHQHPHMTPAHWTIFVAIETFAVLELFAALTDPQSRYTAHILLGLTVAVAALAGAIVWNQKRLWCNEYRRNFEIAGEERRRHQGRGF